MAAVDDQDFLVKNEIDNMFGMGQGIDVAIYNDTSPPTCPFPYHANAMHITRTLADLNIILPHQRQNPRGHGLYFIDWDGLRPLTFTPDALQPDCLINGAHAPVQFKPDEPTPISTILIMYNTNDHWKIFRLLPKASIAKSLIYFNKPGPAASPKIFGVNVVDHQVLDFPPGVISTDPTHPDRIDFSIAFTVTTDQVPGRSVALYLAQAPFIAPTLMSLMQLGATTENETFTITGTIFAYFNATLRLALNAVNHRNPTVANPQGDMTTQAGGATIAFLANTGIQLSIGTSSPNTDCILRHMHATVYKSS